MEAAFDSTSIAKPSFTLFFLGLLLLFANSVPLPDNTKTHSYDFVVCPLSLSLVSKILSNLCGTVSALLQCAKISY